MRAVKQSASPFESVMDAVIDLLSPRIKESIGYLLLGSGIFLVLSLATWSALDPSLNHATSDPVRNILGWPGAVVADMLMQFLGLGAIAFFIPLFWWGSRLIRRRTIPKTAGRILLWVMGICFSAAFVSCLPVTSQWPLPTGLGGIVGDRLCNMVRALVQIGFSDSSFITGSLCALAAIITLSGSCSFSRLNLHDTEDEPDMEKQQPVQRNIQPLETGWEEEISDTNDEPGWGIISLGAFIHAFMSMRSRIKRWRNGNRIQKPVSPQVVNKTMGHGQEKQILRHSESRIRIEYPPVPSDPSSFSPDNSSRYFEKTEDDDLSAKEGLPDRFHPASSLFYETDIYDDDRISRPERGTLAQAMERADHALEQDDEDDYEDTLSEFNKGVAVQLVYAAHSSKIPIEQIQKDAPVTVTPLNTASPVSAAPGRKIIREAKPVYSDEYEFPALTLLSSPKANSGTVLSADILEQNAILLENILGDFGVKGEVSKVHPGPVVTLYELEPAPGTKSSRVIGLADDIARSMSAISTRVAVVPGRNAIGIELPNEKRETVFLKELLVAQDFTSGRQILPLCLGKNIGGEPVIVDLAKMPHLLIAGTTGSGKSVAINTMILSLLYQLTPEQCRLIMVDPKMLELSVYEGIPHLLTPVVTDPKKAVIALKWAVKEMDERYHNMSKLGVRNIKGFNEKVEEAKAKGTIIKRTVQKGFDPETGELLYEEEEMNLEPIPYIVVIVDEMADLMLLAGKEIEVLIQRLAQKARAAGIHVILATQRPSVDVITGTIKANFPTRISFQVSSKIDSRTILGEQGAEQLLGQGDMLYMAAGKRPTRVHGPFCSDEEVEQVVNHLKMQAPPDYLESVTVDDDEEEPADKAVFDQGAFGSPDGDLYDRAVAVVLRDRKASTSYVQRRLQIGYNRAATLIERMEDEGIISAANHAGKREVLMDAPKEDDMCE